MAIKREFVCRGLTDLYLHYDDRTGDVVGWENRQDVGAVLENNKANATHNDGFSPDRSLRRVASIPTIVIEKWRREYGVDVMNPEHMPKVMALLRDPDWRYLRNSPGSV